MFHVHSQNAVMVTLLFPGKEFRISHQQMIKAIVNCKTGRNYRLTVLVYNFLIVNNGILLFFLQKLQILQPNIRLKYH